tara:strand:- start:319 stop:1026 length:708 start_codon:yes stop_codon:yes gene_type:complete
MKVPFYGLKLPNSEQIILSEVESRHCIKVLRYKLGDKVKVLDGRGYLYSCIISDDNIKQCTLDIVNTDFKDRADCELHIIIAPPKNLDRIDWLIEKSVEMGASKVSFVISDRSIRNKIKIERLERISIAAMKQSCSRYKLKIDNMVLLSDVFNQIDTVQRFIPHIDKGHRDLIYDVIMPKKDTCILIGPEGDFTPEEIKVATDNNFQSVSLGDRRLRTETAAIMVIGVFNYVNGY